MADADLAGLVSDLAERARYLSGLSSLGVDPTLARAAVAPAPVARAAHPADDSLRIVRTDLGDCHRCKLAGGRKNIVFGQGSAHAELMFVGEAPGADEDEQGLAFVGKAGQLLTRIIEAIG